MASPGRRGSDSGGGGYPNAEDDEEQQQQQQRLVPPPPPTNDRSSMARTFFIPIKSANTDMRQDWLEKVYLYFALCGAAMVLLGACIIALPLIFSITVSTLIYWSFIAGGIVALLHFLFLCGAPATTSFLLLGALHLGVGLWFLIQSSIRSGTTFILILVGWFVIHGIVKFLMACQLRNLTSWPALLISGVISILLAAVNFSLTSSFGPTFLSFLVGGDLVLTGIAFFLISFMANLASRAPASQEPLLQEATASYHAHHPSA